MNTYGNKALGALCANPNCPGEIISELDQSKLPAGITPAVLSAMSGKICTQNTAQDGFCLVEAAEDALATVALASAGNPVTAVAGGAAKVCGSGCYAALSKDFLVEMKGLLETLVGQTFDAAYADVATMCDASTGGGGGGGSTGTGGNTDDKDEGAGKDEAGKDGDDDKKETAKGITDQKWFLPAVIGGGCALVAAIAFAAVCLTRRHKKNAQRDPEHIKAPLTPRGETGAPVAQHM